MYIYLLPPPIPLGTGKALWIWEPGYLKGSARGQAFLPRNLEPLCYPYSLRFVLSPGSAAPEYSQGSERTSCNGYLLLGRFLIISGWESHKTYQTSWLEYTSHPFCTKWTPSDSGPGWGERTLQLPVTVWFMQKITHSLWGVHDLNTIPLQALQNFKEKKSDVNETIFFWYIQ